jgi:hypothetical protein
MCIGLYRERSQHIARGHSGVDATKLGVVGSCLDKEESTSGVILRTFAVINFIGVLYTTSYVDGVTKVR